MGLFSNDDKSNDSKSSDSRYWGYASYDVDNPDSDSLTYTRYDNSTGKVDKFHDNGDGGHGHEQWKSSDSYNRGDSPDYSRSESNNSSNPSTGDIQSSSGCYLTTACMQHMCENFDDNCEELTILRWFRDNFVSTEDIKHYYKIAPIIVEALNKSKDCDKEYRIIYRCIVQACVYAIKNKNYEFAYDRYKKSILELEEKYARPAIAEKMSKALSLHINNKKTGN